MPTELDPLKARMDWMHEVLANVPAEKRGPISQKLERAIKVHVASTGEALSRESIYKAAYSLAHPRNYATLNELSVEEACKILDPKLRVSKKHLDAFTAGDPDQRALKEKLGAKHYNDPVMRHRDVLKHVGTDGTGAIDSEVLRSANARAHALKGTPNKLKEVHALEADVIAHQNKHFGRLNPAQQKARLDYFSHEHALPQAKEKLLGVKAGDFEAKEWVHKGIKGKFTQHVDGTVLHHVKPGRPVLIAKGAEHEMHMALATTTRMQRMKSAITGGFGKTVGGFESTIGGAKAAAGYAAPVLSGTKKAVGKGLRATGWTAVILGSLGALTVLSSRARNSRNIDNLPPPADDLTPLASIPDYSTPAPAGRQVLGPHTARVLGVGGNAAIQPDMMGNDGASLVDGRPVGNLGPSPN